MDDIDRFLSSLDMFSSPTIDAGIAQARSRELLQEHQFNISHASETLESTSRSTAASAHPFVNTSLNVSKAEENSRNHINPHSPDGEFDTLANDRIMNGEHRTARKRARCARSEHSKLENELDVSLERNVINNRNGTTNSNEDKNSAHESESQRNKIANVDHSKWVCNRCTLINESNAKRCEACNALRSKHGLPYVEDNNNVDNNNSITELNAIGQHVEIEGEYNVECQQCHCINTLCEGKTQSCVQCGKVLSNNTSVYAQPSSSCLRSTNASVQVHVDSTHHHNTNVENVKEAASKQESDNNVITISDSDSDNDLDSDSESSSVSSDSTFSELHDEEDDTFHTPHSQSSSDKGENSNTTNDDDEHHKNVHSNHEEQSDSVSNTELVYFLRNLESVSSESLPLATLPISMRENGKLEPFQLQAVH